MVTPSCFILLFMAQLIDLDYRCLECVTKWRNHSKWITGIKPGRTFTVSLKPLKNVRPTSGFHIHSEQLI